MNTAETINFDIPVEDIDIPTEPEEQPEDWSEFDDYEFQINETFVDTYPPQAADWCDENGCHIEELDPNEEGKRVFKIVKNPEPTAEERKEQFLKQFFKIEGYGYFRKQPKGYSSAVESLNTAFNIVTVLGSLPANTLIFYTEPDFSIAEQCTEDWLIANTTKNEEMSASEFGTFYAQFMTAWNAQEHQ